MTNLYYAAFIENKIKFGVGEFDETPKKFIRIGVGGLGMTVKKDDSGDPIGELQRTPEEALNYLKESTLYELGQAEKQVVYHKAVIEAIGQAETEMLAKGK